MAKEATDGQLRELISVKAYADKAFRTALIADPKGTLEKLVGSPLPSSLKVSIIEDRENDIHIVIPQAASDELSDAQLEAVAGGFLDTQQGDAMLCLGGTLINTKMEINL